MDEMVVNNEVEMTEENLDELSSGNSFNYGLAAIAAAAIGGLVAVGIAISKKIRSNRASKAESTEEKPAKEKKGFRLGKKKLVIIDQRTPVEEPSEE